VYVNEQHQYGLDYNSTVMLTCKLLFAAAKPIVDISPDMPQQSLAMSDGLFYSGPRGGGGGGARCGE